MRRIVCITLLICGLVAIVAGQKEKQWTDWTEKDVKKILDNSGWGQVQSESSGGGPAVSMNADVNSMGSRGGGGGASMNSQPDRPSGSERNGGAGNTSVQASNGGPSSIDYHIRLLSALPIRQAIIRDIVLKRNTPATDAQKAFIDNKIFDQYTVVSVYADGRGAQVLKGLKADDIKATTYLERKDGKRLMLQEYQPPNPNDTLGAKFFFARTGDDGQPFVTNDGGVLKFYSEIAPPERPDQKSSKKPNSLKLTAKFKTSDMMFGNKIEY